MAQKGLNRLENSQVLMFSHITKLATYRAKCGSPHLALQTDKERLSCLIREHLGPDILLQIQEAPPWRNNLVAHEQRQACRWERQSA